MNLTITVYLIKNAIALMTKIFLTGLLIIVFLPSAISQEWPKIFGDTFHTQLNDIIEDCDKRDFIM